MRNFKKKKLTSVLFISSLESLSYSNLYENFRTKLKDFKYKYNGITTTSSSSFSAKSVAQVEKKISEDKIYFSASLRALTSWLRTNLIERF